MASSSSATSGDDRPPAGGGEGGGGTGTPAQAHAEWAASMHAYYAAAAGHPYAAWPVPPQAQQHGLVAAGPGAAYGAPVPFPMYHHPAAAYYAHAHASMAAGVPYMAGESASAAGKGKRVGKTRRVPSGEINSSSGSGDAGSQGSSEKGDAGANQKGSSSSAKRRKSGTANTESEPSQAATVQNAVTEPPLEDKERSASKLLVLAPGRAALTSPAPNLNIGIDPLSASPSSLGQGEVNAAASSQSNASLSQMDERELKRERRKQSNRESARRSRLRKQQECEELAQKVNELTAANGTLRSELCRVTQQKTKKIRPTHHPRTTMETAYKGKILSHDDKLQQSEGPSVVTTLSIQVEASDPHHGGDGKAS